jgi:hypothetical protein
MYDPNNLMGNIVQVIGDRTGLTEEQVSSRLIEVYGEARAPSYDDMEQRLWTSHVGPMIDEIMDGADMEWA